MIEPTTITYYCDDCGERIYYEPEAATYNCLIDGWIHVEDKEPLCPGDSLWDTWKPTREYF